MLLCSLLARFFHIMKAKASIEDEVRRLRRGDAAPSIPDTAQTKKGISSAGTDDCAAHVKVVQQHFALMGKLE